MLGGRGESFRDVGTGAGTSGGEPFREELFIGEKNDGTRDA